MNMSIWVVGTSKQFFTKSSKNETKLKVIKQKSKVITGKTPFFVIGS